MYCEGNKHTHIYVYCTLIMCTVTYSHIHKQINILTLLNIFNSCMHRSVYQSKMKMEISFGISKHEMLISILTLCKSNVYFLNKAGQHHMWPEINPGEKDSQLNVTTSFEIKLLEVYKEGHFSPLVMLQMLEKRVWKTRQQIAISTETHMLFHPG